jgi:hypothetical protein
VIKRKGVPLSVQFKAPLQLDISQTNEVIMEQIMDAIEQSKKFMQRHPMSSTKQE